ncbi:MAG: diguanylate cyclase [Desulfobacterales bacterium]|nr:diguanylate cyclase [Desulfobacterales bacterium]
MTSMHEYRITVLLIDDQRMVAEAVRRALSGEKDIDFHYCQNPTKAMNMAAEIKPTVILQDLVMPEIDGLMMVRFFRVKPETAQVPIIVLSTKEEPEIKSEAFSLGANDYLVKLPDKVELIARIRYHSRSYINLQERDEAFRALQESQRKLAEANRTLQKLSALDGLTGIANRRSFDEMLTKEWQRAMRQATPLSLIMLDIDFFKLYNDHYGHQGGDDCLKTVASALEKSLHRETDLLARYGGEEFSAILPETNHEGAMKIAEIMRAAVQAQQIPHAKSTVSDYVSISVGVATCVPDRDAAPDSLIALADQALYLAKENGRNRVMTKSSP